MGYSKIYTSPELTWKPKESPKETEVLDEGTIWRFLKLGGPCNKVYHILGFIFGFSYFGKIAYQLPCLFGAGNP